MNYSEYRRKSTPSTVAAVARLKNLRKNLSRDFSPVRGFLNKYLGKDQFLYAKYVELCNYIKNYIETSNLPDDVKSSILTWETFQAEQKGPAAPLNPQVYDENILGDIQVNDYSIDEEMLNLIDIVFESLMKYLQTYASIDVSSLLPAEEWKQLPNTTVRGFPFNNKGALVDEQIIQVGGTTMAQALEYYRSSDDFLCFAGFRVQGKTYPGPAKLRLVYIPPVHSQYLDNALISESMRQLKNCPIFTAWMKKDERDSVINTQNLRAHEIKHTRIQLDWSKFDKHIHPYIHKKIGKYFHYVTKNGMDIIEARYDQFLKFRDNQYVLLANERNVPTFYKVPYQLPSGEKRTQHDGSLIGLLLQGIFYKVLFGGDIPWELTNQAGDDALWPVPTSYIIEWGYQGLLEKVAEINSRLGFKLNPQKAYPNTDGAFLQRLYSHEKRIGGIGSFSRALASFIWKEKFSKKIKGVERLWAIEIISQITILSEPFSRSQYNIHGVVEHLVLWWLENDDRLVSVIQFLKKKEKLNSNQLFQTLIKLTNLNFEEIQEELGILSYDHKNLIDALTSKEYGEVFPVLEYLIKSEGINRKVKDLETFVDVKDLIQPSENFDSEIGDDD